MCKLIIYQCLRILIYLYSISISIVNSVDRDLIVIPREVNIDEAVLPSISRQV